jgi:putative FmdB family regulatory protein
MPRYVFRCEECHEEFEKVMHMDELGRVEVQCPRCGSRKVEQAVASFAAVTSKKS